MPKIKIKDFKGIFTNLDENDSNLEAVRDSINFYHKRGFLQFIPRHLQERANMPDTTGFGYDGQWDLETGIYTTLTSDKLATDLSAKPISYDVLVLIYKVVDSGITHRLIWLWDGTTWNELSSYSCPRVNNFPVIDINNYHGITNYTYSTFSTTLNGTPYFQVENGRLKIYFPHMAFWVGRIERKIWLEDYVQRWPITDEDGEITYPCFNYEVGYWYIDRLIDRWSHTNQNILYMGERRPQTNPLPSGDLSTYIALDRYQAANNDITEEEIRRLGISFEVTYNTDLTSIVNARKLSVGTPHGPRIARYDPPHNVHCVRQGLYDDLTEAIIRNPSLPFPTNPEIWTFPIDKLRTIAAGGFINPPIVNNWTAGQDNTIFIGFTEGMARLFRPVGGDAWSTIPSYEAKSNGMKVWLQHGEEGHYASIVHSISLSDWMTMSFEYGGEGEVQDLGYDTDEDTFSLVTTAVLDDREEIPMDARIEAFTATGKFAIRIQKIKLPWNITKRITRIRFYHKLKDGADYELVKEFDLLKPESSIEDFEFTDADKDGNTLAGNVGYLWDYWNRPGDLRIINNFRSFITESGISIGLSATDIVSIYHSTFGGGNLMPDLIYDDNRLPVTGVSKLTAVGNADGRLMAFTDNTAYAIEAEEVSGVIGFRIEDTVELGVKNQQDIANIQGGIAVHTMHGIYVTNGYETKSISEPIDDIIVQYYNTGRIYYNRYKHILYYKPTNAEDLYQYRFKDNVWEKMNKTTDEGIVQAEEALD